MIQPKVSGRLLPRNDWEGDDFTPGAGGHYVTCQDTATGRMVAYATNGKVDRDGRVYRAAVHPHDPDGVTLGPMVGAVRTVARLPLTIPSGWRWAQALGHLKAGRGLIIDGWYAEVPRAYRYQQGADFAHAMWASHYSPTSGVRVWDPLNPDTTAYGRWIPPSVVRTFVESLSRRMGTADLYVGFVPLQPL